ELITHANQTTTATPSSMHWTQRSRLHKSSVPLSMSSDVAHCLADYVTTVANIYSVSLRLDCHMLKTATQTTIYCLRAVTDIDSDYDLPVTQTVTKTVTLNRQIIIISLTTS
ncbi:hypothetical protein Bpfe_014888, partial [Biomphalaria pfeifferi]